MWHFTHPTLCSIPRELVLTSSFVVKDSWVGSGFESQRGKLQVSSMFACNYILHADYHGVSGFSVSYVPVKLKFLHDMASHFRTKNVVWPTHPHVRISTCWTYVRYYLNMCDPWKWQVRAWSTACFRSSLGLLNHFFNISMPSPTHQFFAPPPLTSPACPWWCPTHDWLQKLAEETSTHLPWPIWT